MPKCEAQPHRFRSGGLSGLSHFAAGGDLELVQRSFAGLGLAEIVAGSPGCRYGVKVLMESGAGHRRFLSLNARQFRSQSSAIFICGSMTQVNMDLMQDICYRGLFHLDGSGGDGKTGGG